GTDRLSTVACGHTPPASHAAPNGDHEPVRRTQRSWGSSRRAWRLSRSDERGPVDGHVAAGRSGGVDRGERPDRYVDDGSGAGAEDGEGDEGEAQQRHVDAE